MPKTLTRDEFITRSKSVHGSDRYGYEKVEYRRAHGQVTIFCPVAGHGYFSQRAWDHLQGNGCRACKAIKHGDRRRDTLAGFVAKAEAVHGAGRFGYGSAVYRGSATPLTIVCQQHGPFRQSPNHHLMGESCPRCARALFAGRYNPHSMTAQLAAMPGVLYYYRLDRDDEPSVFKIGISYDLDTRSRVYGKRGFRVITAGLWHGPLGDCAMVERLVIGAFRCPDHAAHPALKGEGGTETFRCDVLASTPRASDEASTGLSEVEGLLLGKYLGAAARIGFFGPEAVVRLFSLALSSGRHRWLGINRMAVKALRME